MSNGGAPRESLPRRSLVSEAFSYNEGIADANYAGNKIDPDHELSLEDFKEAHPEWYASRDDSGSFADTLTFPFRQMSSYRRRLLGNFSAKLTTVVGTTYLGAVGFEGSFVLMAMFPYLKDFVGIDAATYQAYDAIIRSPYSMKAFFGVISDTFPICGYTKKWYLISASSFAFIAYLTLTIFDLGPTTASVAVLCLFLLILHSALTDLLVEGTYVGVMLHKPRTGSDMVSFHWYCFQIGGTAASLVVGPLTDYAATNLSFYKWLWLIPMPFGVAVLVPLLFNFLPQIKTYGVQTALWMRHQKTFTFAILLGLASIGMSVLNFFIASGSLPSWSIYVYAAAAVVPLMTSSFWLLPVHMAKANLYMFLCSTLYINLYGVTGYYYTAGEECVPDGPAFSYTFMYTYMGLVKGVFAIVGITVFQAIMGNWRFRPAFWVSTGIRCFAACSEILIFTGWTKSIGIPDEVMYGLGTSMVYQMAYMMDYMPAVVLNSKLCSSKVEATTFAILAGCQSFGTSLATAIGGSMVGVFGIQTVVPCDFDNLALMVLCLNVLLPLLSIPFTFLLIPNLRMTDSFDEHMNKVEKLAGDEKSRASMSDSVISAGDIEESKVDLTKGE